MFKLVPPIDKIILASASPRRQQFLTDFGIDFTIATAAIKETPFVAEQPDDFVKRMAVEKATAISLQYDNQWIIAADTVIAIDQQILGKPQDATQAVDILMQLSGKTHQVLTGYCLLHQQKQILISQYAATKVKFWAFPRRIAAAYIACGESMDKAGAYAIQGRGTYLVQSITGSYSNVVGLPMTAVINLLLDYQIIAPRITHS
jgi:septum formation protein